jgi:branched-chain amino acid transport system substrate-binding protein
VAVSTTLALLAACGGSRVAASDTASQNSGSAATDTAVNTPANSAPAGSSAAAGADSSAAGAAASTGAAVKPAAGSTSTAAKVAPAVAAGASAGAVAPAAVAVAGGGKAAPAADVKAGGKKAKPGKVGVPAAAVGGAAGGSDSNLSGAAAAVAATVKGQQIFGGSVPCKPASLSPINIGNVSTLSGVLGQLFSPVVPALKTFVASQNACGGLSGHPIKLFVEDDQDDPSTAVAKINDEIKNDHVLAFSGNIQVLTDDAIVATIKRAGIPVIGMDITNNTWFSNPLFFPQGSGPQSISYGYAYGAANYFHKKKLGDLWCIEVPQACTQIDGALKELGPKLGLDVSKTIQVSLTAPSFTTACLDFKSAATEVIAMTIDAASIVRVAKSCSQVGYTPSVVVYPLAVGNEKQFLVGDKWLANSYVPINTFPWMASDTPAQRYYQAMIKKYNPGFTTGDAASLGWTAGALLVAAGTNLSANPTTQELLTNLYSFKGQDFTHLGGLTPAPLSFRADGNPTVPYCLFAVSSDATDTKWVNWDSTARCTDLVASNDPQRHS